jgi:large subunit ribosomal protein L1
VRGLMKLPYGTGKKVRVAVFARGEKAAEAEAAGAHVVGAEDLVAQIQDGVLDFDRCIATPDTMPLVGRVARVLGPRGMMPNPKLGTVTMDIKAAVEDATGGQIEFRTEKKGIIHAQLGRASFPDEHLLENLKAFMVEIQNAKPDGAKGIYLQQATLSTTMGPGARIDLSTIDPSSAKFFRFST